MSMNRKQVENGADFDDIVKNENDKKLHVVDLYSKWCGPCDQILPTLKTLEVSIDSFTDRCDLLLVEHSIVEEFVKTYPATCKPCFLFYQGGNLKKHVAGMALPQILKSIEEYMPEIEVEE